jgi:Uma2 family endonuclease
MNIIVPQPVPHPIVYPESDGKPMAENTKQMRWIVLLYSNLHAIFRDRSDVFVAADNLWYPVEGHPEIRNAPDVYVAFGRPKGDRGSYRQWEENNIPLTVVFEILSPGNTAEEMDQKLDFYDEYGVEEYYIYNPDTNRLSAFVRRGEVFRRVRPVHGFISPRLSIRFDLSGPEMIVTRPNGQPFRLLEEAEADQDRERELRLDAEKRTARLALLSRKARQGQTTAEELAELERLEEQSI